MDFEDAGEEETKERHNFETDLLHDLSNATGLNPDHFDIKKLSPGSIIVEFQIRTTYGDLGPSAEWVSEDLKRQVSDAESLLCSGLVTRHARSLIIVPTAVCVSKYMTHQNICMLHMCFYMLQLYM